MRTIFHLDMDAFFASLEIRDRPELRGKPVIVCGDPTGRGVVTSPSYEARPFGIRAGMATAEARRLCPQGIFLEGDHKKYAENSLLIQKVLLGFTPYMEPVSIDEAFMEVTFRAASPEAACALGREIKQAVFKAVGATASVGGGPNKLIAKLASDARKPDGLTIVWEEEAAEFVASLPVGKLWGVGEKFETSLRELGVRMTRDVLAFPLELLVEVFGVAGESLYLKARGIDDSPVVPYHEIPETKSVGHEVTFDRNVGDVRYVAAVLASLADRVAERLRERKARARTVTVKVRFPNFVTRTRRVTLYEPTDYDGELFRAAVSAWNRFSIPPASLNKGGFVGLPLPLAGGLPSPPRAADPQFLHGQDAHAPEMRRHGEAHAPGKGEWYRLNRAPLRRGIRLLGLSAGDIHERDDGTQETIFEEVRVKEAHISHAMDGIRKKYGAESISRARCAHTLGHEREARFLRNPDGAHELVRGGFHEFGNGDAA